MTIIATVACIVEETRVAAPTTAKAVLE